MDLNLESLEDLLQGLTKQASEEAEEDEKKDEEGAEKYFGKAEKDVKEGKKDVEKAKDKNSDEDKKDKKDDEKEQTKEAQLRGANLAKEVMQKIASISLDQVKTEDNMTKQAADAGKALAQALLEKLASAGDQNTMDGIASATPMKTQVDLAAQVAEQDKAIQAQPGTDGAGNGGTVNQIFDAIVADAMAHGAAAQDRNPGSEQVSAAEGAQVAMQAPNQVPTQGFQYTEKQASDEHEKAAAVSALVEEGFDFGSAVNLVKAAAEEIEAEEDAIMKQAAFDSFIQAGFDFDQAVELTKVAGSMSVQAPVARKAALTKEAAQLQKKAAVDLLLENGVDFATAAHLVSTKSQELFGV